MICSNYKLITKKIENLKILWLNNGFPMRVIDRLVRQFFDKIFIKRNIIHSERVQERLL